MTMEEEFYNRLVEEYERLNPFTAFLDPEKHEICSHCNGYGSSLKEEADRCTVCGGSGLVKKPVIAEEAGEEC